MGPVGAQAPTLFADGGQTPYSASTYVLGTVNFSPHTSKLLPPPVYMYWHTLNLECLIFSLAFSEKMHREPLK